MTAGTTTTKKKKSQNRAPIDLAERALSKQIAAISKSTLNDAQKQQLTDYLSGVKSLVSDVAVVSDPSNPPTAGTVHDMVLQLGRREREFKTVLTGIGASEGGATSEDVGL